MAGVTKGQIIGGQMYKMYSPEWYAARDAQKIQQAGVSGQAAGTAAGAGITTLREAVPDLFGGGGTSSSKSTSTGTSSGSSVPRVSFPSGSGSVGGVGGGGVPMPGGGSVPSSMPRITPTDTSAADAAIFARAKDTVGDVSRGSITALRSALAGRGQLGGGGEFRGTSSIIERGMGELGDVARELAIQSSERGQERAALEFQGGITQRGQDLSAQQAANALAARLAEVAYQGEITQRGQDLAAARDAQTFSLQEQQQQQLILDRILNALTPLY